MVQSGLTSRFGPGSFVSQPGLRSNRLMNEPVMVGSETILLGPVRPQEFVTRGSVSRHRTFHHIDRERHRIPRYSAPLPDITRRYMYDEQPIVARARSGTRTVRTVHSRGRTPLPLLGKT